MLRKLRIAAAVVCFALVTLLFLDFTGTLHAWFGWLARIQFLPALLAVNVGVVAALVVATLLFGRVYCSVVCPLGVMQDGISHLAGQRTKNRFRYSPAKTALRYTVLALFIAALAAGIGSLVALLAPVQRLRPHRAEPAGSALGLGQQPAGLLRRTHRQLRLLSHRRLGAQCGDLRRSGRDFRPHRRAGLAQRPHVVQHRLSRGYGTGLPRALLAAAPAIDPEKCVGCNRCARNCKASCIDVEHHRIRLQPLRGLHGLHRYLSQKRHRLRTAAENPQAGEGREERVRKEENPAGLSRRSFLSLTGVFAAPWHSVHRRKLTDGGLAVIEQKKKFPAVRRRSSRPAPRACATWRTTAPAASSAWPSVPTACCGPRKKFTSLMQPEMSLRTRLLPPLNATKCSEVCPAGAIFPVTAAEEVVRADRPCRLDTCQLRAPDRRRRLRQLRPPLPVGGHHDGTVRHRRSRLAEDSGRQHRALHRLRRLRKPLSGTPVQRDLRRRARTPPNHLTPETHGDQR